ncbi:hypothetical protein D3C80_1822910 [compost metagenome]
MGHTVGTDKQFFDTEHRQGLKVGAQVFLLQGLGVLVRGELEHAIVEKQQANRQIESAAGQHDVQRFPRTRSGPRRLTADD